VLRQPQLRGWETIFVSGTALQSALRQLQAHFSNPRTLVGVLVVGLVLGFAGPFGTFEAIPLLQRLAYWLVIAGLTYAAGFFLSMYADAAWGHGRSFALRLVIMALPAGISATAIVVLISIVGFTASFSLADLLVLFAECTAVSLAVVTLVLFLIDRNEPASAAPVPTTPEVAGAAPILDRVPLGQRGKLLALSVEDHYVYIVTGRGKTLVLMRLADAIRETGAVDGLQIHRSHWVARCAVVKAHRADGRVVLELTNGMRLPVSRGFLPEVRAAGLA
jgi:DNA-binding LytR/AlgR family response regulator